MPRFLFALGLVLSAAMAPLATAQARMAEPYIDYNEEYASVRRAGGYGRQAYEQERRYYESAARSHKVKKQRKLRRSSKGNHE